MGTYYIVFNSATYDLMSLDEDRCRSPHDLIRYLSNRDAERLESAGFAFSTHLITAGMYLDHGRRLAASRNGIRGVFERHYDMEKDPEIKQMCK